MTRRTQCPRSSPIRIKWLMPIFCFMFLVSRAYGGWIGPQEVVSGTWGSGAGQFYFASGDSFDSFPKNINVDKDGVILISDENNKRIVFYNKDGNLKKIITPPSEFPKEDSVYGWPSSFSLYRGGKSFVVDCEYQKIPNGIQPQKMCFLDYNGKVLAKTNMAQVFPIEAGYILLKDNVYSLYSPVGQLIKTSITRPAELGITNKQSLGGGQYKYVVMYPDRTITIQANNTLDRIIRDSSSRLNGIEKVDSGEGYWTYQVSKYSQYGIILDKLKMPVTRFEPKAVERQKYGIVERRRKVKEEYGEPVIAPNGDVYAWKRTPDKYSILKWTWVDDPKAASE